MHCIRIQYYREWNCGHKSVMVRMKKMNIIVRSDWVCNFNLGVHDFCSNRVSLNRDLILPVTDVLAELRNTWIDRPLGSDFVNCRLYPGIAPWWVYYFRPTIAAFAITGTNSYYWALTDPQGGIILNMCYNTITGTNPYSWTLTTHEVCGYA